MAERLQEYQKKRNFGKTPEPPPRGEPSGDDLRFVVQHHLARRDHFDFRLEWDGTLLSWAVPKGPSYHVRDKRLAVRVEDHPLDYRHFEGTIPKGEYGGGTVMLWDEGIWEPLIDPQEGLRNGSLKFILHGQRLRGKWALVRMQPRGGDEKENWLLIKEKDEFAQPVDGIAHYQTSVRTGRTMEAIEAKGPAKPGPGSTKKQGKPKKANPSKNPFDKAPVQLAKLVNQVPKSGDWLYEVKYDGYRIIAYLEGEQVRLLSRNYNDYTEKFSPVADALATFAKGRAMVLDGEMVIIDDEGRSDFQALQNYLKSPRKRPLCYIIFDLLALDGEDLRERPLLERKELLEKLLEGAPDCLQYSAHVRGQGEESLQAAREKHLEGIVGKRADSLYSGSRSGDWIKLKCENRQEFVIGGYTRTEKKSEGISALLLGVFEGDSLIYCGRAGTGIAQKEMPELEAKFQKIGRKTSPFKEPPKAQRNEKIFWLSPKYAAEIKFAQWTGDRLLRQASFKGLRTDKDVREIRAEWAGEEAAETPKTSGKKRAAPQPEASASQGDVIEGVKISSPEKLLFPGDGITKMEVVRYYHAVAERMLPYLRGRILSIVRCPQGVEQACFFKKHPDADHSGLGIVSVKSSKGKSADYYYIRDLSGLIYEVQMNTLEFHVWGSRAEQPERPDMMVFDLDPDEGMALDRIRQGVKDLKSLLDDLSLTSYLKTSGGKGYHIVVPFEPTVDWDTFHEFARSIAVAMETKWPDRYTSNVRKDQRKGRIFIDWIRNGRGATSVAPYSIRARKGAAVSMPLSWRELSTVAPDGVDMADALERIRRRKDPWEGFFEHSQRLRPLRAK